MSEGRELVYYPPKDEEYGFLDSEYVLSESSQLFLENSLPDIENYFSGSEDELSSETSQIILENPLSDGELDVKISENKENETLQQFLQRLTDRTLTEIIQDADLLNIFATTLIETFRDTERLEDALENLWRILERMNNLDNILSLIRRAETVRQALLDSLDRSIEEIQATFKFSNFGRLVGSVADISGTVGGLLLQDSSPGYANFAFRVATSFGLLSIASTFTEMDAINNMVDHLMEKIKHDQEVFEPIQRWYQQTDELNLAVQAIFPFDEASHNIEIFRDVGNETVAPVTILAALLRSTAEQDIANLRDETRIRNLINLSLHPDSQNLLQWLWYRRHPVVLDVAKILLQLQSGSPWRFALTQFVPALSIADQNISSIPVWGRIGLNLLSIYDSVKSLRGIRTRPILNELRHLRQHYFLESVALRRIAEFIDLRSRNARPSNP